MFRNPVTDLIVVLVVALLIFGPKRLPMLGRSLGQGLREFKDSISGNSEDQGEQRAALDAAPQGEAAPSAEPRAAAPAEAAAPASSPAATPPTPPAAAVPPPEPQSAEVGSPEPRS